MEVWSEDLRDKTIQWNLDTVVPLHVARVDIVALVFEVRERVKTLAKKTRNLRGITLTSREEHALEPLATLHGSPVAMYDVSATSVDTKIVFGQFESGALEDGAVCFIISYEKKPDQSSSSSSSSSSRCTRVVTPNFVEFRVDLVRKK